MGLRGKARDVGLRRRVPYTEAKIENFSCGKLDVRGVARESDSIEMSE